MPPAPTRMVLVPPATWQMQTDVAALAMPARLCSASQVRSYPAASASGKVQGVVQRVGRRKPFTDIGEVEGGEIYHRGTLPRAPAVTSG